MHSIHVLMKIIHAVVIVKTVATVRIFKGVCGAKNASSQAIPVARSVSRTTTLHFGLP